MGRDPVKLSAVRASNNKRIIFGKFKVNNIFLTNYLSVEIFYVRAPKISTLYSGRDNNANGKL